MYTFLLLCTAFADLPNPTAIICPKSKKKRDECLEIIETLQRNRRRYTQFIQRFDKELLLLNDVKPADEKLALEMLSTARSLAQMKEKYRKCVAQLKGFWAELDEQKPDWAAPWSIPWKLSWINFWYGEKKGRR
jgi:hypothetical protein